MGRQYEFEYDFSPEDLRASLLDIGINTELREGMLDYQRSWARRWPLATALIVLAPLGLLECVEWIAGIRFDSELPPLVGLAGLFVALAYVYGGRWSMMLRKCQLRHLATQVNRRLHVPGVIGRCRTILNEAGVMTYAIGGSEWLAWSCVHRIEHDPGDEYLVMTTFHRKRLAIPVRAMTGVAPADEVARFARECSEGSGGRATLIAEFLEDFSVPCGKCAYPLHGRRQVRCPECGAEVEFRHLADATPEPRSADL